MFYRIVVSEADSGEVDVSDMGGFEPRMRRVRAMNRNLNSMGCSRYVLKSNKLSGNTNFLCKE